MCQKHGKTEKVKGPPRSPYRRHRTVREPIRPRLPRTVIATARVNLNSYWSRFEELSNSDSSLVAPVPTMSYSTYHDNDINENLVNELIELCKK